MSGTTVARGTSRPVRSSRSRLALLVLVALALTAAAEAIGSHKISIGLGAITLFPIIWGLVLGAVASIQRFRPVPIGLQKASTYLVEAGVLLLGVRLAFVVGHELPVLRQASAALLLQELGHLFGTVALSLPLAVLLRMGRSAVGACFSIDREASFAMVSERFGPDSDEYRGVLGMYIFGSVVGALYVTLLASFLAGTGWLDPLALAMGTGVGSGSVMAASSAAIAAQHPELANQIVAVAAVSNLVTTLLGLYVGMFVALPLADRFYRLLTRGRTIEAAAPRVTAVPETAETVRIRPLIAILLVLLAMVVSNVVHTGGLQPRSLLGFALVAAVVLAGLGVKKLTGLPAVAGTSVLAILLTSPISPVAGAVLPLIEPIEFLAMATPILVFAGLSIGKDVPALKRIGWRIVPVGLTSFAASFLISALIAQALL
ncbi:Protein of unknown function [Saccharopolyspora kobensis]|uniref:DUF3100 family protein n=1 Tax=Saccharopolyspora kobensis TaxID=146035 RepID=A0A1H5ZCF1_9PSEU|nr:DUF3100 domain-containing protein [Saccharopolyspora kobensis]SEG33754.1 Protein of unknown function [Saccharopolyspora kobensis]SFF16974.1 Protein of unknown function [Saccharopolyspora kobensis]